jgi:hypothetical protein
MTRIIGFAGPAGGGKDTAGAFLAQHGWHRLYFAKWLKDMLATMGYPEPATQALKEEVIAELGVSWRHLAQTLGTEWGRERVNPHLWTILAAQHMKRFPAARFYFTDVRFENEAKMIREEGGLIVHLTGRKAVMAADTQQHASEKGIEFVPGDLRVHNDVEGIAAFHEKLGIALRAWL